MPYCFHTAKLIHQEPDRTLLVWYPTYKVADGDSKVIYCDSYTLSRKKLFF